MDYKDSLNRKYSGYSVLASDRAEPQVSYISNTKVGEMSDVLLYFNKNVLLKVITLPARLQWIRHADWRDHACRPNN